MQERSLSAHLLSWILPFIVGVNSLISLSDYLIARQSIHQQLEKGVRAAAVAAAAQVQARWAQYRNDVITISQSPLFRDYAMNTEFGLDQEAGVYRGEIERMLLDFSRRSGAFPRVRLLDLKGREICRVQDGAVRTPSQEADPDAVRELPPRAGQPRVSRLHRLGWHRWPVVSWTTGVFDEAGKPKAQLVFDASLGPTYESLRGFQIGERGQVRLTDSQGGAWLGRLGRSEAAAAGVPGTPWAVVVTVDRWEFLRPLARVQWLSFLMAVLAAVILALGLSRQMRYLLAPVRSLADAALAFAEGELDRRVEVTPPREVGILAHAFNAMAGSLKRRTDDLVQRVRELTALHSMNDAVLRQLGRSAIGKSCLDAAVRGLGFERGLLFWVDEDRGEITGECVRGMERLGVTDDEIRAARFALGGGGILAEVVRHRAAIYVEDAARDPRCDQELVARFQSHSFCAAPIMARGRVIAIMTVAFDRPDRPIPKPMMRSFSLFCGAAGIALENARLIEDMALSEERYRAAVENSPQAVIGLDQNFRITLWNRRAEALFGFQPSEAAGRTLEIIFGEQAYQGLRRQVETEGSIRSLEAPGRARDGRRLDLNVSWTGQSAGAPGAREWFVVIQDETEKKRLQAQLIQAEKLSAVGSLIAGVAHELNNPLAAVTGFAELLKDLPAGSEEREDLRQLHVSALRCRDIVQALLSFVRQGGSLRQRVSLNFLVQAALSLVEYKLVKTEGIRIETEFDATRPYLAGDFSRLQQILVNLLNNSCDALRGRQGRKVVRVRTRVLPDGSSIEVEDNGSGVSPEVRARLFEPFVTTKPVGMGTGLGLSICAQIAKEAGARLFYEDVAGGGARFIAKFPPCPAGLQEADSSFNLPPACPGARVLVVDDEPDLANLMSRLLSEDAMEPTAVADLAAARQALEGGRFDLVVTDIDLGGSTGFEVLDAVQDGRSKTALLLVTGDVLNREIAREAAERGVAVLAKPFLRTDFQRAVRRALAQRKAAA